MPEGDAVWRTADRLRTALDGRTLVRTDFRVPQHATADLAGGVVVESISRGKHLLTRIDHDQQWTLHTHLKMEGSWRIHRRGERWSRPAHLARVVLDAGDRTAVGYQLGVVELLPREREDEAVGHLGPDLLGPDWDEEEAVRRLTADPDRPRGEARLDQRNLAGIGTIYMADSLWVEKIWPWTPADEVADPGRLLRVARAMMQRSVGSSSPSTTGEVYRGRNTWVHGRLKEPCRRCGAPVRRGLAGHPPTERPAYFCGVCQHPAA